MWLTLVAIIIVVIALVASVFSGGIFTIIFIPLAVIAVGAAVVTALSNRSAEVGAGQTETASADSDPQTAPNALPRRRASTGHVTTTPDRLVDARREQQ